MIVRAALATIAAGALLSGCVAAVVPVIAGGAIGKKRFAKRQAQPVATTPAAREAGRFGAAGYTLLPLGSVLPPPSPAPPEDATPAAYLGLPRPAAAPDGWRALVRYVAKRAAARSPDLPSLAADLSAEPCGERPEAVVLDADLADSAIGTRDAAVTALNAIRTMGATIVFAAYASPGGAIAARQAIARAGFGDVEPGKTLFVTAGAQRQAAIMRDYCVIAIGGARADDFPGTAPGVPWPWGEGWFLIPDVATPPQTDLAARSTRDAIPAKEPN